MQASIIFFSLGLVAAWTGEQRHSVAESVLKHDYGSLAMDVQETETAVYGNETVFSIVLAVFGVVGALWFLCSRLSKETPNYEMFRIGLNCVTYAACSVTMHMLNKSLAITMKEPALVALSQMVVAVAFFGTIGGKDLLAADRKALLTWCIVPLFFATVLISSFYTYEYISLSMLTIMRNLMPLIVLPVEMVVMPPENKPRTNTPMVSALIAMLLGASLYAGSLDISMLGVAFAVLNMCIGCADRLIQKRLLNDHCKSLPSTVCSMMNNGVSILPTVLLFCITSDLGNEASRDKLITQSHQWTDPIVLILLLTSSFVGMGVGYFGMEVQRDISATSVFVLQNVAKIGVVFLGIVVFGDPIKSFNANIGLLMSLIGSGCYGHFTMKLQEEEKMEKQKLMAQDSEKASA